MDNSTREERKREPTQRGRENQQKKERYSKLCLPLSVQVDTENNDKGEGKRYTQTDNFKLMVIRPDLEPRLCDQYSLPALNYPFTCSTLIRTGKDKGEPRKDTNEKESHLY